MIALIIDDEEMIRSIGSRILQKAGFEVITAEDGQSGIQQFVTHKDDIGLVIVDYFMDGLSGIETIRKIREISASVPCVLSSGGNVSADGLPDDLRENTRVLQKPYRADQMMELARELVQP